MKKPKPKNRVKRGFRVSAKGVQILTGKESVRANSVDVGIYSVEHDGEEVQEYAKGERVNIKIYLPDETRFEKQYNTNLREVTVWFSPDEFRKILKKSIPILKDRIEDKNNG